MDGRLGALDWIVIGAATVALVILLTWLVQGAPAPRSEVTP